MRLASRAAAIAAITLALTAPAVGGAHAQGRNWKTLSKIDGGKIQACKVATTATGPWKIKLRVDADKASSRVNGSAYVTKDGKNIDHWKSGWVTKGHTSALGTVKLPRGSAYALNAGIAVSQAGNGGSFKPGDIRAC
jgi:hypothetical protein